MNHNLNSYIHRLVTDDTLTDRQRFLMLVGFVLVRFSRLEVNA